MQLSVLVRLVVALILSGILGWERERANRPAGLRTHMTVGMSAALFVVLSDVLVTRYAGIAHTQTDPIRMLQAILAGISFLGAGTIFVMRGRNQVRGLTTAASLLATSGVGVAAGLEAYIIAVGSTILLLVVLAAVGRIPVRRSHHESEPEDAG